MRSKPLTSNISNQYQIQEALLENNATRLELFLATGSSIQEIKKKAESCIRETDTETVNITKNLKEAITWFSSHANTQSQISSVFQQVFQSTDPKTAEETLRLFFYQGGKLKDLTSFLRTATVSNEPDRVLNFLEILFRLQRSLAQAQIIKALFSSFSSVDRQQFQEQLVQLFHCIPDQEILLHLALDESPEGLAEFLIENGFPVDAPYPETGHTPLHFACMKNQPEEVSWLLEHGARSSAETVDGETPLHIAAQFASREIVEALLLAGGEVNAQTKSMNTPLHIACSHENKDALQLILEHGANVNIQNNDSATPLHLLVYNDSAALYHPLLNAGADTTIQFLSGQTAVQLLLLYGERSVVEALFSNQPYILEIYDSCKPEERVKKIQENCETILERATFTPLEVPFLLGNIEMAREMAQSLSTEEYQRGIEELRSKFTGAKLDLIYDATVRIEKRHILQLGTVASPVIPQGFTNAEWEGQLELLDISQLLDLFNQINFENPDKPGYRDLRLFKNSDGAIYSLDQLHDKLSIFVKEIKQHVPKIGTPSLAFDNPRAALIDSEEFLLSKLTDYPVSFGDPPHPITPAKIQEAFAFLQPYVDTNELALDIDKPVETLHLVAEELAKITSKSPEEGFKLDSIQALLDSIQTLSDWYKNLERNVKTILYTIESKTREEERPDTDPTPFASTIIELAIAGGQCGGRYMDDSQKLCRELSEIQGDLHTQILTSLQHLHHRIAESMTDRKHEHNVHIFNRILQIIDEDCGIKDDQKKGRFYFDDAIYFKELKEEEVLRVYYRYYTPTLVLNKLQGTPFDRELMIDWFADNVPEDWQNDFYQRVSSEIEGMQEEEAIEHLRSQYEILIYHEAPPEQQLFENMLATTSSVWDLKRYQEISEEIAALSQMKAIAVKRMKNKYGIELNLHQPLTEQIKNFFIEQFKPDQRQQFLDAIEALAKIDLLKQKIQFLEGKFPIKIKHPIPVSQQIEKDRVFRYLADEVIDQKTGQIKRKAWIYLLKKFKIFSGSLCH